jgi:hypothetical protein
MAQLSRLQQAVDRLAAEAELGDELHPWHSGPGRYQQALQLVDVEAVANRPRCAVARSQRKLGQLRYRFGSLIG